MKLPTDQVERIGLGAIGIEADQHLCFYSEYRLKAALQFAGFHMAVIANVKDLPLCQFPDVAWQSAALAVKLPVQNIFQDWQKK